MKKGEEKVTLKKWRYVGVTEEEEVGNVLGEWSPAAR